MILPIIAFIALAFWIHAERRLGIVARVCGGLAFMLSVAGCVYVFSGIIPKYERSLHRACMRLSGELIAKGESQKVEQAINTYNGIAANGSTYQAAMEMWKLLNQSTNTAATKP